MTRRRWLAILIALAAPAVGEADESWVGQRVVVKRAGVAFGYVEAEKWVNAGEITELVVTVLEQRGEWVLVRSGGKRGWVRTAEVVRLAEATAYFTGMIEAQPRVAGHHLRLAAARAERGEYEKAAADCTEAIRLDPGNVAAHYCRATVRHLGKLYDAALKDYAATVRLAPDHPGAHSGRAWLRATCPDARYRDGAAAVRDARRACELTGWNCGECLDNLAAAFAENGQFDEAVRWQMKALESPTLRGPSRENALGRVKLYEAQKPYRTDGRD